MEARGQGSPARGLPAWGFLLGSFENVGDSFHPLSSSSLNFEMGIIACTPHSLLQQDTQNATR